MAMNKVGHRKGDFSASLRLEVIKKLSENKTQREIAHEVGITPSDVCRILYSRNKIISDFFDSQFHKNGRRRRGKYYHLDRAVAEWFMVTQRFHLPVNMDDLARKAEAFSKRFGIKIWKSDLWCKSWKQKYSVVRKRQNTLLGHVRVEDDNQDHLALINSYKPEEVYTVSEISFGYDLEEHSTQTDDLTDLENQGADDLASCFTILVSCNQSASDKRPLIVIGKKPAPFVLNLPCIYKTDKKCWMSSDIFVDWLLDLDQNMKSQNRRILLVLKKSPVHPCEVQTDLSNIKLLFVDSNSGILLPCENGVAHHLKLNYKKGLVQKTKLHPQNKVQLLDTLHLLCKSWIELSPSVIKACYNLTDVQRAAESGDSDLDCQCYGMPVDDEICARVSALPEEEAELDGNICASKCYQQMDSTASESEILGSLSTLRCYIENHGLKDFGLFYTTETQVMEKLWKNRRDMGFESVDFDKWR